MKVVSWNVNGLRAVQKKDAGRWLEMWFDKGGENFADVICLQEIKISSEHVQKDEFLLHPKKFNSYWSFAEKPGYSGLAIYARKEPSEVREGLGIKEFDCEGRWLEANFGEITLINSYFPNSQREHTRLPYKLRFCKAAESRLDALRSNGRRVFLCGDFNIAHREIDLKNPKSNVANAGFLPEERAWMDHMISDQGWVDGFREFEKGPGHYTWWSYRPGVREKNVGWRLDYFLASGEAKERMRSVEHLPKVMGSDHCPVRLTLKK